LTGTLGEHDVRLILFVAAAVALAGAAHAQLDPFGRPKALNPLPPLGSTPPLPSMPQPAPFRPYAPPTHMQPGLPASPADPYPHARHAPGMITPPAATPTDPYPGLHPRRRRAEPTF
jgi:hypothetical protein